MDSSRTSPTNFSSNRYEVLLPLPFRPLGLKARHLEALLYAVIWLLVFSLPYFGERALDEIHWGKLLKDWLLCPHF
ncbi:MAG: hypothetical protein IPP94_11610 [Ignavibacteria bacterium]|nr:hypothetical protein [Ignavibacteria bacterium]